MKHIPWIEKYRPTKFKNIVLNKTNKQILINIIQNNYFPNLLFYGPPGTGKTTTITNLIKDYQKKYKQQHKGFTIHLNASDDRGIDIIRNQLSIFAKSNILFGNGLKFIILDEVDYMTKNAQKALHYLIQESAPNICFCLICNYISRINCSLQDEFLRLHFCNLPKQDTFNFLKKIISKEKLNISPQQIKNIQNIYRSDIRSMINYLQSNIDSLDQIPKQIITNSIWKNIIHKVIKTDINKLYLYIEDFCVHYNISNSDFIELFIEYLFQYNTKTLENNWVLTFKFIIHNININHKQLMYYFLLKLKGLYKYE